MAGVVDALEAEWVQLGGSRSARRALRRWAQEHPVLDGFADLHELLDGRRKAGAAHALLGALAQLAADDELAARTLLHALMPGLVCLARDTGYDDPHALDELVSLAWERIRTYPATREGSVAANVLWDVRKRYRAHRSIEAPKHGLVAALAECGWAQVSDGRAAEDEAVDRVAFEEVMAAGRAGAVSAPALALVVRSRYLGEPLDEIAREQQVRRVVVQQRRWRAERALRRHVPLAG